MEDSKVSRTAIRHISEQGPGVHGAVRLLPDVGTGLHLPSVALGVLQTALVHVVHGGNSATCSAPCVKKMEFLFVILKEFIVLMKRLCSFIKVLPLPTNKINDNKLNLISSFADRMLKLIEMNNF